MQPRGLPGPRWKQHCRGPHVPHTHTDDSCWARRKVTRKNISSRFTHVLGRGLHVPAPNRRWAQPLKNTTGAGRRPPKPHGYTLVTGSGRTHVATQRETTVGCREQTWRFPQTPALRGDSPGPAAEEGTSAPVSPRHRRLLVPPYVTTWTERTAQQEELRGAHSSKCLQMTSGGNHVNT